MGDLLQILPKFTHELSPIAKKNRLTYTNMEQT